MQKELQYGQISYGIVNQRLSRDRETRSMTLIAHRGFAREAPENTLKAFQQAASHAEMIELDLRRCRSGELVVIHDGIVDAVTDSRGRVEEFTATELEQLNVLDSGEGVPTFEAVLETLPSSIGLNIELKERNLVSDVVGALDGTENEIVISSASTDVLTEVTRVDRPLDTALIFTTNPTTNLERAKELGCQFIQPHWGVCVGSNLITNAHDHEMGVFVWSISSTLGASIFRLLETDGIIADRPVRPLWCDAASSSFWSSLQRFKQPELGVRLAHQILRILTFLSVILLGSRLVTARNWIISRVNVVDRVSNKPVLSSAVVLLTSSLLFVGWKLRAAGTDRDGRWRGEKALSMRIKRLRIRATKFVTSTRVAQSTVVVRSVYLLLTLGMLLSYAALAVGWNLSGTIWKILQNVGGFLLSLVKQSASRTLT